MKLIRKHLSYANVVASLALFIALGGSAYAVGKYSIGTAELKNNAVTTPKIKRNAVTAQKIRNNAVTATKIRRNAVTGAKIRNGAVTSPKIAPGAITASKLAHDAIGTVDRAKRAETAGKADSATVADNLANQVTFHMKMRAGEQRPIASHGAVSLYAKCYDDGDRRYVSIFADTTVDGAVLIGNDEYNGWDATDFLNTDTDEQDRVFLYEYTTEGKTYVDHDYDYGFVLGPDGKGILANSEGIILGVNYAGVACITAGVVNKVG